MLRQIAEHGGICGINFAYDFISDEKSDSQLTTIDGMIRHMKYIRNVAGIDTIGFGSDFDGIGNPVEVKNAAGMQQIAQKMEDAGFTLDEIEKVFYKNALRVYKQVLG
jgi:membrane dipeptidase